MNKRLIAIIVVLVVVIGGAIGALALSRAIPPSDQAVDSTQTVSPEPSPSETPDATPASSPGVYLDYTETAIADAQGKVVLFFHAPWCGQCRHLEEGIIADGVPDGVTIIKVDWDTHQDLEVQYRVPMRTTFVELDASGEVVQRLTAYDDPRWEAVIETMAL